MLKNDNPVVRKEGNVIVVENAQERDHTNMTLRALKVKTCRVDKEIYHVCVTWQYVNGHIKKFSTAKSFAPGIFNNEDFVSIFQELWGSAEINYKFINDASLGKVVNKRIGDAGYPNIYPDFTRITKSDVW